jgi:Flp pilus assembly protein TadB
VTATTGGLGNPVISTIEDVLSALTALAAVVLPWLVLLVAVIGIVLFLRWRIRRAERLRAG